MKLFTGKLALSVVGAALLATASYAQTPDEAVHPSVQGMEHHRIHHARYYDRHAVHTGTARQTAAILDEAPPYDSYSASASFGSSEPPLYDSAGLAPAGSPLYDSAVSNDAAFAPAGSPLYDSAVSAQIYPSGVACLGGRGVGRYPNGVAYGESEATVESGGEFFLDRGYRGCFAFPGD